MLTVVLYSMIGSFPLFFAGGYAIRIQTDLSISKAQFGWAVSTYFIASAVGSFTIGNLIDRWGARFGFMAAATGGGIASIGVGLAGSFPPLALALGIAGLGNTSGQLASNRVLARLGADQSSEPIEAPAGAPQPEPNKAPFDAKQQGTAFGVKQAAVPFGSFCAGAIVGLGGSGFDWRTAFFAYAVIASAAAALAWFGPIASSGQTAPPGSGGTKSKIPIGRDWPFLLALATAGVFGGATGNGFAVLTVDAFGVAGYSESVGALALSIGSAITIFARIGIGTLAGRRDASGFVELGSAMALGGVGFALLAVAGENRPLLWIGAMIGFLAAWGWPGVMYYTVVRNASTGPATATGVVVAGVFFGGIIGTPVLGAIADHRSYATAWTTASLMAFLAAALVYLAGRLTFSNHHQPQRYGADAAS